MKYAGLDLLRGLAAFGIVGCHLALQPWTDAYWRIHELCDVNVGVFAAVSGFLMWTPESFPRLPKYIEKRFRRLVPIYLLWSLVFILFGFVFDAFVRHSINPKWLDWSFYPKVIFGGQASAHLWFLICLFYVQSTVACCAGVLRRLNGTVLFMIGLFAVWVASIYHDVWMFGYPVRMFGFVLAGCALRMTVGNRKTLSWRKTTWYAIVAASLALLHYVSGHDLVPLFVKDYLLVLPIFLAFIYLPVRDGLLSVFASRLGSTSLGVYLVHPIITAGVGIVVREVFRTPFGLAAMFFDWTISYIIALVITCVLLHIPFTKKCI